MNPENEYELEINNFDMTTGSTLSEIQKSFQNFSTSITGIEKAYGKISRKIDEFGAHENIPRDYLTEMAGNLANEIRNPLGGIANLVELLSQDPQARHSKNIDGILDGVRRIDQIVENLIIFSRPVELKSVACNFTGIIGHAIDSVKARVDTNVTKFQFNFLSCEYEIYVKLDPVLILQALQNIMVNSVEAMPEGGEISIKIEKEKKQVALEIKDEGLGLKGVNSEKPFYPFYTTKANGMGLGLPTARLIIEKHAGKIWIDDSMESGTEVRIIVPIK